MSASSSPSYLAFSQRRTGKQVRRSTIGVQQCRTSKSLIKLGQPSLHCIHCGESIHLNCLCKQFNESGNEALKNKLDLLSDFVNFTTLHYQYKACMAKHGNIKCVASTKEVNDALVSQDIFNKKKSLVVLDSKISSILLDLGSISYSMVSPVTNGIDSLATSTTVANKNKSDLIKLYIADIGCDLPRL